jgi:hypothetical protein
MRTAVIGLAAVLSAAVWMGGPASASTQASPWQVQDTPTPAGYQARLVSLSCPAPGDCMAVGFQMRNGKLPGVPLAEQELDGTWSLVPPVVPVTGEGELLGVSCSSATQCIAVGYAEHKGTDRALTLAESWNGTAWSIQASPSPSDSYALLNSVSCSGPDDCTAVGYYAPIRQAPRTYALAEQWDGTSWSSQATPTRKLPITLSTVSCFSATQCEALGFISHYGRLWAIAEGWNGTQWTIQPTPAPAPGMSDRPQGVSCAAALQCESAGYEEQQGTGAVIPLAVGWAGTGWSSQSAPSGTTAMYGVSCPEAAACTAVGADGDQPQAEVWNGATWTSQATTAPPHADSYALLAVSCATPASCTAVGYWATSSGQYGGHTLAEQD